MGIGTTFREFVAVCDERELSRVLQLGVGFDLVIAEQDRRGVAAGLVADPAVRPVTLDFDEGVVF
ncbi:hypothetical protein [Salinispora arenicola]|uniref:hypothetical protein n=1 Tax=Salinispora arenicola TaxID=168697 RepID=UPI0027DD9532|nr:hypothetical protein [Salinispora arenicola]